MKKLVLLVFAAVFFATDIINAQNVGINNTNLPPDPSAGLDVNYTDKGVLIPRVALTGTNDVTTVPGAATSLLVYNTATVSDVTPGFYYWDGTQWIRIVDLSNSITPSGGIIMYSGIWNFDASGLGIGPLSGWALCNGNNGTPDLTDKFVMGTNVAGNLNQTGGANSYSLTVSQLPAHNHSITSDGSHSHTVQSRFHGQDYEGGDNCASALFHGDDNAWPNCSSPSYTTWPTSTDGSHDHGGSTGNTGSGAPIDNRPAYIKLAFIMKL